MDTTSPLARGLDQLGRLLAAVTPDDVDRPTPCAEWTVADLSDGLHDPERRADVVEAYQRATGELARLEALLDEAGALDDLPDDPQRVDLGDRVAIRLDDGSEHDGVASLGIRPMFDPPEELLEANLFGFDGDLYGRTIEIMLHHYLRPEAKFADLDALMSQMAKDAEQARALLKA